MNDFIKATNQIGRNLIFIQGAGGNSSVKRNGKLYIKASGFQMKNVKKNYGISCIDLKKINSYLINKNKSNFKLANKFAEIIEKSIIKNESYGVPSMETGFHAVIPSKYIFHMHSVYINIFTCMKYGTKTLSKIISPLKSISIDFANPGFELTISLKKKAKRSIPNIIFLKNHGVIIHGNDLNKCLKIIDLIHKKIELYLRNKKVYKKFLINRKVKVTKKHFFPDSIVFGTINPNLLNADKKKSYFEIMSANKYIFEMIKKLNRTPIFIKKKNINQIMNLNQEIHRLKIFHAKND